MAGRWSGCTIVCIASGPSLTADDCQLVEKAGLPTIAVNSSWKLARFAQVIYAGDSVWWDANLTDIDIEAERWTCSENAARKYELNVQKSLAGVNSGLQAIRLAIEFGAERVILLGYDCSVKNGTHWHGNHAKTTNPNAAKCHIWNNQFKRLISKSCKIINCSRYTALSCFPKITLEEALR